MMVKASFAPCGLYLILIACGVLSPRSFRFTLRPREDDDCDDLDVDLLVVLLVLEPFLPFDFALDLAFGFALTDCDRPRFAEGDRE